MRKIQDLADRAEKYNVEQTIKNERIRAKS